jgi:GxxExxY protein
MDDFEDGSGEIIGALIEVHRTLGPGLLESTYEACFCRELEVRGRSFERQRPLSVSYKGCLIECAYRLDVVVSGELLVEVKTVHQLLPIHTAQVRTYLKLSGLRTALLVNFNVRVLHHGLRRIWLPAAD